MPPVEELRNKQSLPSPIFPNITEFHSHGFAAPTMDPDVDTPEAARTRAIASKLLSARDLVGSKRFAERSLSADPDFPDERADQILAIADVLLASQNHRVNDHLHWYSLLQLPHPNPNPNPNDDFSILLKRRYRRLALLLHPDRNKFPGADSAFELVIDAYNVLSDPTKKLLFDAELLQASSDSLPPPAANGTAFWTLCPSCCHVHQYPRAHHGKSLLCRTCRHSFDAVEMRAPPPIVPGTDTYQSSWGFFPLGFPTSVNSDWKPFVPMFPWTPHNAGSQEPQPPAKQHLVPPVNAAAPPSRKGTKKMARKNVGSALKKKALASEILHARTEGAVGLGIEGKGIADVSLEKEAVAAKGIDMNQKAKDSEEAGDDDGFEMLIDMDVTNDLLGNLQNLPFLRDEVSNIQIP